MCQRKIIGKGVYKIVPIDPGLNACLCAKIVQIRDVDEMPEVTYKCRDIKTEFVMHGYPVFFRFCQCGVPDCRFLPQKTICSEQFGNVDLSKELWTEDGKGMTFEPGFLEEEDAGLL